MFEYNSNPEHESACNFELLYESYLESDSRNEPEQGFRLLLDEQIIREWSKDRLCSNKIAICIFYHPTINRNGLESKLVKYLPYAF